MNKPLSSRCLFVLAAACFAWCSAVLPAKAVEDAWAQDRAKAGGKIVAQVVSASDEDATAAGKAAAKALREKMAGAPLRLVIVSECFEDKANKEKLYEGVCSVLPRQIVVGGATYGSFTQQGCTDADSVCLIGIGGDGISVSASLATGLGTAKLTYQEHRDEIEQKLREAGRQLASKLKRVDDDRLVILLADAHSPKNQSLVEGVQEVFGKSFPITGGCANKNAGQTYVAFGGRLYEDSAVALALSGDFKVSLAGRLAKDNDKVISTARESAAEALSSIQGQPIAALAFDCAGRRGKLKKIEDELAAVQQALGKQTPLFGCYCAGEMGPVDGPEKKPDARCGGSGWHIMFTVLAK